jgi:hypothetical protein
MNMGTIEKYGSSHDLRIVRGPHLVPQGGQPDRNGPELPGANDDQGQRKLVQLDMNASRLLVARTGSESGRITVRKIRT